MAGELCFIGLSLELFVPTCSSWTARPHQGGTEIEVRATRKLMGQVAAADWKLLGQFVRFWWCTVCSSGAPRQVGTNSH